MSTNPNFGVWRPMAENVEFNALESNSNAVMAVADTVRTTLGPKGLDKLLIDQAMNRHVSNDGVTILLSLSHSPSCKNDCRDSRAPGAASRGRDDYCGSHVCRNDKGRQTPDKGARCSPHKGCRRD